MYAAAATAPVDRPARRLCRRPARGRPGIAWGRDLERFGGADHPDRRDRRAAGLSDHGARRRDPALGRPDRRGRHGRPRAAYLRTGRRAPADGGRAGRGSRRIRPADAAPEGGGGYRSRARRLARHLALLAPGRLPRRAHLQRVWGRPSRVPGSRGRSAADNRGTRAERSDGARRIRESGLSPVPRGESSV